MIYFDAGATTLQKPEAVARAMYRAVGTLSSPGRGSYPATRAAEETDLACRSLAAELFGVDDPERVVFTSCATHGLNIAIGTLVKPGSRVVISGYEHNAVTRPLHAIEDVEIVVADAPLFAPEEMVRQFAAALETPADAVICTHVSNVFGYRLPVERIAELCRERGVPFVLDASQSAGMVPVDMTALGAAFAAMPGHKGLLGPQGTGILLCRDTGMPLLSGGTGGDSRSHFMPETLPERLEAGTHNVCGIAGLREGVRYIRRRTTQRIYAEEERLMRRLAARLNILPGLRVYYSDKNDQSGLLSVVPENMSCDALSERLGAAGIAVRSGLHCAPLAHDTAGTLQTGTVRLSVSPFNTPREIDRAADVIENILKNSYKL